MMPEKDQQVIVGFLNGDPNCGVVLGSMWNAKNTIPPGVATEENILRAFVTKGGHSVTVKDGDEGGLTVKTKAGYKIEIAENDKTVIISTADSKQSVTLDENGGMVSIIADKKITLKAQEISLEGKLAAKGQAVSITSDGSLDIKGKQIKIDGSAAKLNSQNTEVTGAMVKVESSGILTLKGSMTKIN